MEKTLPTDAPIPSDQEFIKIVNERAFKELNQNYLNKSSPYSTAFVQYDYTEGAEKKITIPESIALVSKLTDKTEPNLTQLQELTVTLCNKHPDLINDNLEAITALNLNINLQQSHERKELYNQTSTKSAVLESFIGQFYQTRKPAKEIIINVPIQNSEVIINSLKKLYDIKTKFVIPKRGSKAQILRDLLPTE